MASGGWFLICVGEMEVAETGKVLRGGSLFLVDASTGRGQAAFIPFEQDNIDCAAISGDGGRVAAAYGGGQVAVWQVNEILGAPDGRWWAGMKLASYEVAGTDCLWEIATSEACGRRGKMIARGWLRSSG